MAAVLLEALDLDLDTEEFLREQEEADGWLDPLVPSPADHSRVYEAHVARARDLRLPRHSARLYDGSARRVVVFVQKGALIAPVVFDLDGARLETRTDLEALALDRLRRRRAAAFVSVREVEHWAKDAVRTWCESNGGATSAVRMIYAMYLQPRGLDQGMAGLLDCA